MNVRYLSAWDRGQWAGVIFAGTTAVLAACGGNGSNDRVATNDSSGVSIIESQGPAWPAGNGWHLSTDPFLEIGQSDGASEYQFHRVEGALRLDDGRVIVADAGSSEIRFYDRDGTFQNSSGRRGEAPGEYQMITSLGYGPGDSIWVFDYGLRRFTVLTTEGDPVRTLTVGGNLSALGAVGRLADGWFVVKEGWSSGSHSENRQGLTRNPVAVVRTSPNGSVLDTIATVAGREVFLSSEDGRAVMSAPLFGRNSAAAVRDDRVFIGDQETLEVMLYTASGALEQIVRVPGVDLELTGSDIERTTNELLANEPVERRAMIRAHYEQMDTPPTRPAYGSLMVDAIGNLWAAEYVRYPDPPTVWTVFAMDGELLGEVHMPHGFQPLHIGKDWMIGVGRDELDVEYVRLYRIER
jgi:hypothetical protein